MQFFELATLTVPVGTVSASGAGTAAAMAAIDGFVGASEARGELMGAWISELGPQNRIVLLRAFDVRIALDAERQRVLMSSNPFGLGSLLTALRLESFAGFPDLPPVAPGDFGPVYEFRTYLLKIGGLAPTLAAWNKGVPDRVVLSPLVGVMYALDGEPRFMHVWAYRSFEERTEIRTQAVRQGVWPAKGAPEWLTTELKSEIWMPTSLSKLK
jgi:hypothetical protein